MHDGINISVAYTRRGVVKLMYPKNWKVKNVIKHIVSVLREVVPGMANLTRDFQRFDLLKCGAS